MKTSKSFLCSYFCVKGPAIFYLNYPSEMSCIKRMKKKLANGLTAHKVAFLRPPLGRAAARVERQTKLQNQVHSLSVAAAELSESSFLWHTPSVLPCFEKCKLQRYAIFANCVHMFAYIADMHSIRFFLDSLYLQRIIAVPVPFLRYDGKLLSRDDGESQNHWILKGDWLWCFVFFRGS